MAAAAVLASGSLVLGHGAPAAAATAPQAAAAPQAGAAAPQQADVPDDEQLPEVPVLMVTSVEVMRSTHEPTLDVVRVRGVASTDGWADPAVLPITQGAPATGILDVVLVAHPPADTSEPTGFMPVEAIFPLDTGHPYKAVRVRGASNSILLKTLPGYAEGRPVGDDCSKCVGKHFLSSGTALPAGKSAADTVKQEDLPTTLRVVKPADGIASKEHDPNRLTIVIDEDGTIVDAGWD
ncbi:MAG TPA: hypothetical protein VFL55_01895 [Acetobacteraceae bacterium]|nr:hypothetical protein [Acetobacteraceae bacterium]